MVSIHSESVSLSSALTEALIFLDRGLEKFANLRLLEALVTSNFLSCLLFTSDTKLLIRRRCPGGKINGFCAIGAVEVG